MWEIETPGPLTTNVSRGYPVTSPRTFVESLSSVKLDNVFNPYWEHCAVFDQDGAPRRRVESLMRIVEAAVDQGVDALWIGRDLGHKGGRRTGLAFTDDAHVAVHGQRWGVAVERFTRGAIVRERSAQFVWRSLARVRQSVFLWNVFPFHPHQPEEAFSNRRHNARERRVGEAYLAALVGLLGPRLLIAIGEDAEVAARRVAKTEQVVRVRHPSYGGQALFEEQICKLTGSEPEEVRVRW